MVKDDRSGRWKWTWMMRVLARHWQSVLFS